MVIHVSTSCWKASCFFSPSVTTTMGRLGKMWFSATAKNGWAAWLTPAHDNTPPSSRRRARHCTAGVSETLANKHQLSSRARDVSELLVAARAELCAKLAE